MMTFSADRTHAWPHLAMLGSLHLMSDAGHRSRGGHDNQLRAVVDVDVDDLAAVAHAHATSIASPDSPWRRTVPGTKRALLSADWGSSLPNAIAVEALNARVDAVAELPRAEQDLVAGLGHPTHPQANKPRWTCTPWDMTSLQTGGEIVTRRLVPAAANIAGRNIDDIAAALRSDRIGDWNGANLLAGWDLPRSQRDPVMGFLALCGLALLPVSAWDQVTMNGGQWPRIYTDSGTTHGLVDQAKTIPGWWPEAGGKKHAAKFADGWAHTAVESGHLTLPLSTQPMPTSWWSRILRSTDFLLLSARSVPGVELSGTDLIEANAIAESYANRTCMSPNIGGVAIWERTVRSAGPLLERSTHWHGLVPVSQSIYGDWAAG